MNALIDVCLVLLIFFILTTSYAALQSRIDSPDLNPNKPGAVEITKEQVDRQMIHVTVKLEGGKPVIRIETNVVEQNRLLAELKKFVRTTNHTILLLEVEPKVPHGVTVSIQDAAKGAGMKQVLRLVQ